MNILISITEVATYIVFSILAGHVALQFVPDSYKPMTTISKSILLLSTLGIFVFTLGPVVQTISYFSGGVGLPLAIMSVLTEFQVGRAWLFIGFISVFLWLTIMLNGPKTVQALCLFLLILAVGYSSHVASLSFWFGLFSHTIHFFIVTLWTGILIHVAWFSKDQQKWPNFLRWFTPFAIFCFIIIILTGLSLMFFVVEPTDYMKSWVLPYGQMLLLKHISIIPVLIFAFVNGVLAKKALTIPSFNPRPWIKLESMMIFFVFYFTSVLGTLSPPHEVEFTVKSEGAAKWTEWLLGTDIITTMNIGFMPYFQSSLLIVVSFIFLLLIVISFKQVRPRLAFLFGLSFILSMYFGLMLSLTI